MFVRQRDKDPIEPRTTAAAKRRGSETKNINALSATATLDQIRCLEGTPPTFLPASRPPDLPPSRPPDLPTSHPPVPPISRPPNLPTSPLVFPSLHRLSTRTGPAFRRTTTKMAGWAFSGTVTSAGCFGTFMRDAVPAGGNSPRRNGGSSSSGGASRCTVRKRGGSNTELLPPGMGPDEGSLATRQSTRSKLGKRQEKWCAGRMYKYVLLLLGFATVALTIAVLLFTACLCIESPLLLLLRRTVP